MRRETKCLGTVRAMRLMRVCRSVLVSKSSGLYVRGAIAMEHRVSHTASHQSVAPHVSAHHHIRCINSMSCRVTRGS